MLKIKVQYTKKFFPFLIVFYVVAKYHQQDHVEGRYIHICHVVLFVSFCVSPLETHVRCIFAKGLTYMIYLSKFTYLEFLIFYYHVMQYDVTIYNSTYFAHLVSTCGSCYIIPSWKTPKARFTFFFFTFLSPFEP